MIVSFDAKPARWVPPVRNYCKGAGGSPSFVSRQALSTDPCRAHHPRQDFPALASSLGVPPGAIEA